MGKVKFDVDDDAIDAELTGNFYDGPVPPARQVYRAKVKRMELGKTGPGAKNPGAPLLTLLLEFCATKNSDASQYDGYGVWHRLNVTKQGAAFVNQFLEAIAQGDDEKFAKIKKAFWGGGLVVDGDDEGHVIRIGNLRVESPNGELIVYIGTKTDSYKGEERLAVTRFLWPANGDEAASDSGDDGAPVEDLPEDLAEEEPTASADDDEDLF